MLNLIVAVSASMAEARNRAAARADERGIDMVWGIVIAIAALVIAVIVVPRVIDLGGGAGTRLGNIETEINSAPTS